MQGVLPSYMPYDPIHFEDQVRVLLEEKVPAFSFIYGIPPKGILDERHHCSITIIGTATTVAEALALALDKAGVDVVAASGFEEREGPVQALTTDKMVRSSDWLSTTNSEYPLIFMVGFNVTAE